MPRFGRPARDVPPSAGRPFVGDHDGRTFRGHDEAHLADGRLYPERRSARDAGLRDVDLGAPKGASLAFRELRMRVHTMTCSGVPARQRPSVIPAICGAERAPGLLDLGELDALAQKRTALEIKDGRR